MGEARPLHKVIRHGRRSLLSHLCRDSAINLRSNSILFEALELANRFDIDEGRYRQRIQALCFARSLDIVSLIKQIVLG